MSNYLEIIGDDKRVVIDDKFACMEVVDSFPLSQCDKVDMSSNTASWHDYYYVFPSGHSIPGNALVGISLNGITSEVPFSYEAEFSHIRFFGKGSGVDQVGIVSIERDDIIATSTLYIFDNATRTPSKHGVGLEIVNDKNEIVFSSERPYINVLKCGSEEKDSVSTASTKPIIACNLGDDYYYELYQQSHHLSPQGIEALFLDFLIRFGQETVTPQNTTQTQENGSGLTTIAVPSMEDFTILPLGIITAG